MFYCLARELENTYDFEEDKVAITKVLNSAEIMTSAWSFIVRRRSINSLAVSSLFKAAINLNSELKFAVSSIFINFLLSVGSTFSF